MAHSRNGACNTVFFSVFSDFSVGDFTFHTTAPRCQFAFINTGPHHFHVRIYLATGKQCFLHSFYSVFMDMDERRIIHIAGSMDNARINLRLRFIQIQFFNIRFYYFKTANFNRHRVFNVIHLFSPHFSYCLTKSITLL